MPFATAAGRRLEYRWIAPAAEGRAPIVLLHEGLGSLQLWKDFPDKLAAATGSGVLVYSRYGYGWSDVLEAPQGLDYMHREALESLPELLDRLELRGPLLVGHSDGASIALIHAGGSGRPVSGLVCLAPHVFVEELTTASIEQAKDVFQRSDLAARMAKYHQDAERTFWGWNDIWLHPEFKHWNIEEYLPAIDKPVLLIQGADDEYGTLAQIEAVASQVAGRAEQLILPACKHSPHRDQEAATLAAIADFAGTL